MEKIGIIGAMEQELRYIKENILDKQVSQSYGLEFVSGVINDAEVVLVTCGIGKVNGARGAQLLIAQGVDCVVSIGTAGSLTDELDYWDFVVSESVIQHDFNLEVFNYPIGEVPNCGRFFKSDDRLVRIASGIMEARRGIVATGDSFVNDPNGKKKISDNFGAVCDDMESGAVAQVCSLSGVPFVAVRCITDKPTKESEVDFYNYLDTAAKKCADFLSEMIDKMKEI